MTESKTALACPHPERAWALTTAGQYFEEARQHLKWFTGEVVCSDCGTVLCPAPPAEDRS